MFPRLLRRLVFVVSPLLCGCAAYLNTLDCPDWRGSRTVYGGTSTDCEIIKVSLTNGFSHPLRFAAIGTLATIDLPLSVVGDTLTLPITLNHTPNPKSSDAPSIPDIPTLSDSPSRP